MRTLAHAKINWTLRVTGRRPDGYHDLETIFQTISLADVLTFSHADRLTLTCDDPTIPTDETNLVVRAARLLGVDSVAIHLEKRIPAGGGLGGGSSDAAATLVALSRMFALDAPLHELAATLGSDVPFFLVGGTAYAGGRGEVLTPLPDVGDVPLLLLLPEERVLTADAYRAITRYSPPLGVDAYTRGLFDAELVNDFEEPVFARLPQLRELKQRLLDAGAKLAMMSGSGSTIFGAFADAAMRDAAIGKFSGLRAVPADCSGRAA